MQNDELLTRTEVMKTLSIGHTMFNDLRRQGLPVIYLGKSPRVLRSSLLEWLKGREQTVDPLEIPEL